MQTRPRTGDHETREYVLTRKGLDLQPVIIALTEWGDRWAAPDGPPIVYEHEGCGGRVRHDLYCRKCEESPRPQDVTARKTAVMGRLQARRIARPASNT
jgi:hypothetical protein